MINDLLTIIVHIGMIGFILYFIKIIFEKGGK
jgi:preprotein translocase subunit Sss1